MAEAINDFDVILSYLCPLFDEVICVGDVNTDFFKLPNILNTCFELFNFAQVLVEPTRVVGTSGTLGDPLFVSNVNLLCGQRFRS